MRLGFSYLSQQLWPSFDAAIDHVYAKAWNLITMNTWYVALIFSCDT